MALRVLLSTTLLSSLLSLVLFSAVAAVISGRRGRRTAVGFFHPYTNDGGGGERVLWCFVRAMQEENPDLDRAVFTVDDASPQSLAARALDRFGVKLLRPPQLGYGFSRVLQHSSMYNNDAPIAIRFLHSLRECTLPVILHPFRDLVQLLCGAVSGLHSMIDEHFGISVVEYMASAVIPIAHNSAGPKMDIALNEGGRKTGFLASNKEEYTEAILKVITMAEAERLAIAAVVRKCTQRFSEQKFFKDFKAAVQPILAPKSSS
ncbi:Glycosyl transferases group 1 [Musa troglodytarum]|uniref:GDP-Man:Man(3)GlcNAc(2)-PP-Dol alpha-1,2-mannosyltransferase n=1 Tax=Musa troglodytarum TaxID=320322 RepID=A0A9E7I461_9LILI|nr:Glycosyl transferases group 1 [Musa troglodytarum]